MYGYKRLFSVLLVSIAVLLASAAVGGVAVADDHDQFEPNGDIDSAAAIDDGEYENLVIEDGESDFFAVDLEEGEQLDVDVYFQHDDGDLDLQAHDPDGQLLVNSLSATDDESVTIIAQESGTHYVGVWGWNDDSNTYDLEIRTGDAELADRFEPNNYVDAATEIDDGEYEGLVIEDGQSDFFAVELEEGDDLRADVYFDHGEGDLDLDVYDPDGEKLEGSWSTNDDESVTITAEESGTYHVEVWGWDDDSNTYDLELQTGDVSDTVPGFGVPAALVALLAGSTLAARRRR